MIKRVTDGKYVAAHRKSAGKSYTTNMEYVKLFVTVEEVTRDLCPGNEIVISARTHNSIETKQNKTKQNKTKQNKTKQNKTKQNKTFHQPKH